jgi:hypothetical protein
MKKSGFLRKVRLCLCLIWGSSLAACSVLKPNEQEAASGKIYRVVVEINPGFDGAILSSLNIQSIESSNGPYALAINPGRVRERLTFLIRAADEARLQAVCSQLNNSGVLIKTIIRY